MSDFGLLIMCSGSFLAAISGWEPRWSIDVLGRYTATVLFVVGFLLWASSVYAR